MSRRLAQRAILIALIALVSACEPAETPVPPTATRAAPSATSLPTTPTPAPTPTLGPAPPVQGREEGLIVFYSHRDGNIEIYTMMPDGSNQRRLTFNEYTDDSPSWSPDGSQIAFLSDRDDPNPGACAHNCLYQVYIMNADGSDQKKLVATEFAVLHPDWHPDGTKLTFDTESNLQGDIYVVNADGSNLQLLIRDGFWADWSPDGTQIVFASKRDGNVEIYVADADGDNQRRLTENESLEYFPDWSPDGTRIAFARVETKQIFVMDADGSNEQQLTYRGNAENPSWSTDGTQIAYQSSNDGDFEIYTVDVQEALLGRDSTRPTQLTDNQVGDLWPSWGSAALPTASLSLLKSQQTFPSVPTWKIALADLDGDGDLDAVFANARSIPPQIWLNDGLGFFTDTGQQLGDYGHGVDVGDVDGDGDLDVIMSSHQESVPTQVYLNDGNAVFEELEGAFGANIGYSVDLYDIDGDGHLDAVGETANVVNVYLSDGQGHFTASKLTFPVTAVWGDLDSDTDIDVLVKADGIGYSVELNDGRGHFTPHWELDDSQAMSIGDMVLGDVDSDGDLDAIITNGHYQTTSSPTIVLFNDGMGQFTDGGQRLNAVRNAGASLGDLDNDGDLDLVLADHMEPCQIWLNDGSGTFSDSGFRLGGDQFYRHVHLGDLDGDGDQDIVLATFGVREGPNEIWFNAALSNR